MGVYLDNAATSFPKPEAVHEAVVAAMREIGASPGRGGYGQALAASRLLMTVRESLAALINAPDPARLIFTHNATAALNQAVFGVLSPGDHVVTSTMEHNSLLRPLRLLEKSGVTISMVPADPQGLLDPEAVRQAICPATRMIAISHVSNVTGGIQPVAAIAAIAKAAGCLLLLDAAQSVGIIPLDMQEIGVDLLAAPGHKGLMGPQGTGFLALAPGVAIRPLLAGGTGSSSDQDLQPDGFPEGFEAGTHNLPGIAGLGAAVAFVRETGVQRIGSHERNLAEYLREKLALVPGMRLYGPVDPLRRTGVLSLTAHGMDPSELAFFLDKRYGIAVRSGLHCAPHAHRTIGTWPAGTLRVSPGWFSTMQEMDCLYEALTAIT